MPICITGMHRSGTSLMARLLNVAGLYLGRDEDLLAGGPGNPDGHWEHEALMQVNEELLAALGGGWDYPPDLSRLDDAQVVAPFAERARAQLAMFSGREPWGWKDPRTSLTLPFWRSLMGPTPVVWCIRNPLEVALSLRMRNGSTIAFGLALWASYAEALLKTTTTATRVVTHYQRYHTDPSREVARVCRAVGLQPDHAAWTAIRDVVRPGLRHSTFSYRDLIEAGVSAQVRALYRVLCEEAHAADEAPGSDEEEADVHPEPRVAGPVGAFNYDAMERLRRR